MTAVVADLALEAEAATVTAVRLARAHDDDADDQERAFRRLATAVSKYYVCKRGPGHAVEALECLGGNGYIETFPLARRYREQPVMAIWEGSGNVVALDVLRAITREPESVDAFDAEVSLTSGVHPLLDSHLEATRTLLISLRGADASDASAQARRIVESLAIALQASLLVRTAPHAVSDVFITARLGETRGSLYGTLPPRLDLATILARH
jgi:putative acyl-CoA dehydrogenase